MKAMIRIGALMLATGALGFAGGARAQEPMQDKDKPCTADAARLCPNVEPGGGAQMKCLKEHKDELSSACKQKISGAKERMQQPEPTPPSGENPAH